MIIIQVTEEQFQESIKKAVQSAIESQKAKSCDELLNRKAAASYLGVTLPTIHSWEKKGIIKGIRYGSRVYFSKNDLMIKDQLQ